MLSQPILVIALAEGRVTAASAVADRTGVRITASVRDLVPPEASDPRSAGRWLKSLLRGAGISARRAVFVLPRGEAVVKRIGFPAVADLKADLPGMVRLQMLRQLPFSPDDAAIDFMVFEPEAAVAGTPAAPAPTAGSSPTPPSLPALPTLPAGLSATADGSHADGSQVEVLAAAVPGERIRYLRDLSKAAGLKLARVCLASTGIATLLRADDGAGSRPVMGLAASPAGVEFVVLDRGQLVFSRRADLALPTDGLEPDAEDLARRTATEAKRTWTSYRVIENARPAEEILVLGRGEHAERVARLCADAAEAPARALGAAGAVRFDRGAADPDAVDELLPLAGVILEGELRSGGIDLAHPRRAPDRRARIRQLAMGGALALLLVVGTLFTLGLSGLRSLDDEVKQLREDRNEAASRRSEALRRAARVEHLVRWEDSSPDWIGHLVNIHGLLPSPDQLLVDQLDGAADMAVTYPRQATFDPARYASASSIKLNLTGRSVSQTVSDATRDRFVRDRSYRVAPIGLDGGLVRDEKYPHAWGMSLTSSEAEPADAAPAAAQPGGPKK
ncbi:MAG: hypothetical protein IBJ11_00500 [Phycisphaerales bacterium]|nr:hypothetical protein [Phycisphaerales bacterium]